MINKTQLPSNSSVPSNRDGQELTRSLNPSDISVPAGFHVEVFAQGLDTPISLIFTENGEMLVADAGVIDGNGKVLRYQNGQFEVIADHFHPPLTGIHYHDGKIYVSHRGFITTISSDGTREDVLSALPSYGDHHNNKVEFGADGKMYFGQGTATNSGVVGPDNTWVKNYPFFHDYPGSRINLFGENFISPDTRTASPDDIAYTGAYSPFGVPNAPFECVKGIETASGSILRANPDGSNLELVAWGLRNPFRIKFDHTGRLLCANHGADVRGSRPINNSPDEFQIIHPGIWYGWPDFTGGLPVNLPIFRAEGHPQPQPLIINPPMIPPKPFCIFSPHSAVMGFDFDLAGSFGPVGDAYIAEYGSEAPETTGGTPLPGVGHRVSRIDMTTGNIDVFAINSSGYAASHDGGGGLERPIDVVFGPDQAMYVVDFVMTPEDEPDEFVPGTGVIWRIVKD